jgi:hypothetical protein
MDLDDATLVYDILKDNYEINDDNVGAVRWAQSFTNEYAGCVRREAQIVVASIHLGQSVLSLGELMRPLFNATHKLTTLGVEIDMPGAIHFVDAAKTSSEALGYIKTIGEMTEEYATCVISCDNTHEMSYI